MPLFSTIDPLCVITWAFNVTNCQRDGTVTLVLFGWLFCLFVLPFWRTMPVVKLLVFSNSVLRTSWRGMGYVVRRHWRFCRLSAFPYNCWLPFLLLCSSDIHFSPDNNFLKWLHIYHLCGFSCCVHCMCFLVEYKGSASIVKKHTWFCENMETYLLHFLHWC